MGKSMEYRADLHRPALAPTARRYLSGLATLIAGLSLLSVAGCGDGPARVILFSPLQGTFTTASSVLVQGALVDVNRGAVADVQVNGVAVMQLNAERLFSITVPL